jgi:hypothetical protein
MARMCMNNRMVLRTNRMQAIGPAYQSHRQLAVSCSPLTAHRQSGGKRVEVGVDEVGVGGAIQ